MSKYRDKMEIALNIAERTVKLAIKLDKINKQEQQDLFVNTYNTLINENS